MARRSQPLNSHHKAVLLLATLIKIAEILGDRQNRVELICPGRVDSPLPCGS